MNIHSVQTTGTIKPSTGSRLEVVSCVTLYMPAEIDNCLSNPVDTSLYLKQGNFLIEGLHSHLPSRLCDLDLVLGWVTQKISYLNIKQGTEVEVQGFKC